MSTNAYKFGNAFVNPNSFKLRSQQYPRGSQSQARNKRTFFNWCNTRRIAYCTLPNVEKENGSASPQSFAPCIPEGVNKIREDIAIEMFRRLQYSRLETNLVQPNIETAHCISPASKATQPPLLFLHGFDSSILEFRFLLPFMDEQSDIDAHFIDILGWGFTEKPICPGFDYGPSAKREHIRAYHDSFMGSQAMVLVGASIGGAAAIDFVLNYPERVEALVLIDAQAFVDKQQSKLLQTFPIVASWGAELLRSDWLRRKAIDLSYQSDVFKSNETLAITGLHCRTPGWKEATVNFVLNEGYCIKDRVQDVACPTLVIWGDNDRIVPIGNAQKFVDTIGDCRLEFVKDCGHSPHIEKPSIVVDKIMEFVTGLSGEN